MDPKSQRAVEEEVESYALTRGSDAGRGDPATQVPEQLAQLQLALFQQMTEFFQQIIGALPQAQPQPKSHLEEIRKYGAVNFKGKKEDNPVAAECQVERIESILQQLHCTPEQSLECAVSLLQEDAY